MNVKTKKIAISAGAGLLSLSVLGVGAVALTSAGAASLGGFASQNVGSDVDVIAACDTDGVSNLWALDNAVVPGQMSITSFNLMNVNAGCDGGAYEFAVYDAAGAVLGSATGTLSLTAGSTGPVTLSVPVDANAAASSAITILSF